MLKFSKPKIFSNSDFLLLWTGQLISKLGDQFHSIAAMWYVYILTGSSLKMGLTLICAIVPSLLFSPLAGIVADKFDRKKIIIVSNFVSGSLVFLIYILIFTHSLNILLLYFLTACITISTTFFSPSISAAIPSMVEKDALIEANSLSQFSQGVCGIFGPVIAGILIAVFGVAILFLLDSVSFFIAALFELFIYIPKPIRNTSSETDFRAELKEGFAYAIKNKELLHFIIVGGMLINFFLAPLSIYIPIFSKNILHMGSTGYSSILTAVALGGVFASIFIPFVKNRMNYFTLTFIGLTMEGVSLMLFFISSSIYTSCIFSALFGISVSVCNASLGTVFQILTPNNMMGRVSSIMSMMCTVSNPLGIFVGGLVLEIVSVKYILLFSGIIVAISGFSTIKIIRAHKRSSDTTLEMV